VERLTVKNLIGILGWVGVALVGAAVILRFTKPDSIDLYKNLAYAGLAVTLLYAATQWRDIKRSFGGRNIRYGSMAAGSVVLVLGILVALNFIGARRNKRWDLTENQQFGLSEQTKQVVAGLQKPLNVKVFYQAGGGMLTTLRDRLNEYDYLSDQMNVEYINADEDPIRAKQYEIQNYGTIVLEYEGRREKTTSSDESGITNAIKKVVEGRAKKIYFLAGHGEHDPTVSDRGGYSQIAERLKGDNFETAKLVLAQEGKIPADASVLVIAGPKADLLPPEVEEIRAFLKRGGKLIVMLDPPDKLGAPEAASLVALAKEWGVTYGNDIILDVTGMGQIFGGGPTIPVGMPTSHPITQGFDMMTGFPYARTATPTEGGAEGKVAQKIVETAPQSWAEIDLKGLFETSRPSRDLDKGDKPGPLPIAAAVSAPAGDAAPPAEGAPADGPKPETRLVFVGDSDFASNMAIGVPGNGDLFLNMANWAAQQDNLIAIRPKDPSDRRVVLTEDQTSIVKLLVLVVGPVLLLANAVRVWWKKR
jgi:ABC-type uncharacterized transport system involved in gliding motility auxiliary subunit